MKIKNLFCTLFASILLLAGVTSCNDGTVILSLEPKTVYCKMGEDLNTYVYGNGGYQLTVSDESKFTATEKNNIITIHPVSRGQATLTVTDSDKQVATMTVYVVDPYLAFGVAEITSEIVANEQTKTAIEKDIKDNYILKDDYLYDLKRNDVKNFVEYEGFWKSSARSGMYSFSDEAMKLTLTISDAESTFDIENNTYGKIFYDYFTSDQVANFNVQFPLFKLTEDLTAKYQQEYPDGGVSKVIITANVQALTYRVEYSDYNTQD